MRKRDGQRRNASPLCARDRRREPRRAVEIKIVRPFAAGNFAHAAEQAFPGAAQENARIVTQHDEGGAAP
jgi:hypothetical protein